MHQPTPTAAKRPRPLTVDMLTATPHRPSVSAAAPASARQPAEKPILPQRPPCVSPMLAQVVQVAAGLTILGGMLLLLSILLNGKSPSLLAIAGTLAATTLVALALCSLSALLTWAYTLLLLHTRARS